MASNQWDQLADKATVDRTIAALQNNNISASFVETGEEAKQRVVEVLPPGAEVMNMTSVTLETIGVVSEVLESGTYSPVRPRLDAMDADADAVAKKQLGAGPEWVVGSVHAVTEDGRVVIASNTGSQLPAYAYGAMHVIWVVGTQKIVKDLDAAMQRIYEHSLPLESERARKAYGVEGSNVSKLLVVNEEVVAGRINIIFVNEKLGF